MTQLGQLLQQALKDAKMPYGYVASCIGISEANLYRLFKKDTFEVAYLKKAAELVNLPISHFFEDNPSSKPTVTHQTGDFNQSATNNIQKVKGGKAQSQAADLDQCQRDNEALKRELVLANALVAAKEETSMLLCAYRNPN